MTPELRPIDQTFEDEQEQELEGPTCPVCDAVGHGAAAHEDFWEA
jgi:hypothetical protein